MNNIFHLIFIALSLFFVTLEVNADEHVRIAVICDVVNEGDCHEDSSLMTYLRETYGNDVVKTFDDTASNNLKFSPHFNTVEVVIVTESVSSWTVSWLQTADYSHGRPGIVTLEGSNNNEFWLAKEGASNTPAGSGYSVPSNENLVVLDNSHYITDELGNGSPTVTTDGLNTGYMRGWETGDAKPLGVFANDVSMAGILAMEKGGNLVDKNDDGIQNDGTANTRTVFVASRYPTEFVQPGSDGKLLLDRAIEWAGSSSAESKTLSELNVVLVCEDGNCTNDAARDLPIFNYLNGVGVVASFDVKPPSQGSWSSSDLDSFDVAIISESISSWTVNWMGNSAINDGKMGILTMEGSNNNEFWLAKEGASLNNILANQDAEFILTDHTHYITQDFADGMPQITSDGFNTGYMRNWETGDAQPLALFISDPTKAGLLVFEKGDNLVDINNNGVQDDGVAPTRIAFLGGFDIGAILDEPAGKGKLIFSNAVDWAAGAGSQETFDTDPGLKIEPVKAEYFVGDTLQLSLLDSIAAGTGQIVIRMNYPSSVSTPVITTLLLNEIDDSGVFQKTVELISSTDQALIDKIYAEPSSPIVFEYPHNVPSPLVSMSIDIGVTQLLNWENYDGLPAPADCDDYGGDTDKDGICNHWEDGTLQDSRGPGLYINYPEVSGTAPYFYPCDPICPSPTKADIYLEIDWMDGHKPNSAALQDVKNSFLGAPDSLEDMQLHIDDSEMILPHSLSTRFVGENSPVDANGDEIPGHEGGVGLVQYREKYFGTADERDQDSIPGTDDSWREYNFDRKKQVFHYALFVHSQQEFPRFTSSGVAEFEGDDFMVSLGTFSEFVGSRDQQAGTIMHELGHNLGLDHGGDDATNCKPSYLSVMSYSRQFSNYLDRPLDYSRSNNTGSFMIDQTKINEQEGTGPGIPSGEEMVWATLDANGDMQVESGPTSDTGVNWNGDGVITGPENLLSINLNDFPNCGGDIMQPLEVKKRDWQDIVNNTMDFKKTSVSNGYHDGIIFSGVTSDAVKESRILRLNSLANLIDSMSLFESDKNNIDGKKIQEDEIPTYVFLSDGKSLNTGDKIAKVIQILQNAESKFNNYKPYASEAKLALPPIYSTIGEVWLAKMSFSTLDGEIDEQSFATIMEKFHILKKEIEANTTDTQDEKKIHGMINEIIADLQELLHEMIKKHETVEEYAQSVDDARTFLTDVDQVAVAEIFLQDLKTSVVDENSVLSKQEKQDLLLEIDGILLSYEKEKDVVRTSVHKGELTDTFFIKGSNPNECDLSTNTCVEPFVLWIPDETFEVTWINQDSKPHKIVCTAESGTEIPDLPNVIIKPGESFGFSFEGQGVYECADPDNKDAVISYVSVHPEAVPEFETTIMVVFVLAIVSLMIVSAKTKLMSRMQITNNI